MFDGIAPTRTAATDRPGGIDLAATLAFLAVMLVTLFHHAMWRDELNAWALVAASETPAALFHNMHYEGHPALWHALLWPVSRLTDAPVAMQAVHSLIASAAILLVGLFSPFSRLERVLLLAGFFIAFEYSIVSRNYGIALLLALLHAQLRATRPERLIGNALLLALLANTTIWAAILSGAMALVYAIDRLPSASKQHLLAATAIYLAGLALAAATLMPAPDIGWEVSQPFALALSAGHFAKTLLRFLEVPFLPIRPGLLAPLFLTQPAESDPIRALWLPLLLLPVPILALATIFRRDRDLLALLALSIGGAILFGHVVYSQGIRHWGISFVAVLACLWLQRHRRPAARSMLVLAMLALGAIGGLQAIAAEWVQPYSQAKAAANWIAANTPEDAVLAGSTDTRAIGVATYLRRPLAMLECGCTARFLRFSRQRDGFSRDRVPQALAAVASQAGDHPVIFIASWPLTPDEQSATGATELHSFTGSRMQEDFVLYRITSPARGTPSRMSAGSAAATTAAAPAARASAPPAPPAAAATPPAD